MFLQSEFNFSEATSFLPPPPPASISLSVLSPTVKWTAMVNSPTDLSPSVSTEEGSKNEWGWERHGWGGWVGGCVWGAEGVRDADEKSEKDRATPEGWVSCDREWCPLPLLLSLPFLFSSLSKSRSSSALSTQSHCKTTYQRPPNPTTHPPTHAHTLHPSPHPDSTPSLNDDSSTSLSHQTTWWA